MLLRRAVPRLTTQCLLLTLLPWSSTAYSLRASSITLLRRDLNSAANTTADASNTTANTSNTSNISNASSALNWIPPNGLALVPDLANSQWTWLEGTPEQAVAAVNNGFQAFTADPADVAAGIGGAPGGAPSPASAFSATAPAPAPAVGAGLCESLRAAGDAATPGAFLDCREFRYYSEGVFAAGPPYGCHCGAWSVNCPFETCPARMAWEEQCLAPPATELGFTALSKTSHPLSPSTLPKPAERFEAYPGIISLCMYWLQKPMTPTLPPLTRNFAADLPIFASLQFAGVSVEDCLGSTFNETYLQQTKAGFLQAIQEPAGSPLAVVSVQCGGNMTALVEGPPDLVGKAVSASTAQDFCFTAGANVTVCSAAVTGNTTVNGTANASR